MITYWGLGIFCFGIIGYLILRKSAKGLAGFLLWFSGVGIGIIVGGVWFYMIASTGLDRIFGN